MSGQDRESLIRLPEVLRRTSMSKSQIYALIKQHRFPAPIELIDGSRSRYWVQSEVDCFIADRIAVARKAAP